MGLEVLAITASVSAFLSTAVIGSVTIGQILLTVALTGAQFAMAALQRPRRPPGVDQSVKQNVRQPDVPFRRVYGTTRTGGAIFFWETKNPYLYAGYAYNDGEIDGVAAFTLNGKSFRVDQFGNAIDAPFYRSDGSVFVKVSVQKGTAAQGVDPLLAAEFLTLPASFKQPGIATVVIRAHFGNNATDHDAIYGSGGQFEPQLTLRGAKVYDPRDPGQSRDDSTTWRWSDTASLIIADYMRWRGGARVDPDRIDWDSVAESADRDEQLCGLKGGGWQKRYTINGVVDASQQPREVISAMLTANRGRIVMSGRMVRILSGMPRAPIGTLHAGMVIGAVEYRGSSPRSALINRVRTEFVAPDREWTTANGPVLDEPDFQAMDGAIYEQSITLPFTDTHQRAQRLARAFMLDARYGRYLTAEVGIEALPFYVENAGQVIRVDIDWLPVAAGLYVIERVDLALAPTRLVVSLSEYHDDIEDDFIPDRDEQPFVIAPAAL